MQVRHMRVINVKRGRRRWEGSERGGEDKKTMKLSIENIHSRQTQTV